eukprot:1550447-Rhodomonas_salina.2
MFRALCWRRLHVFSSWWWSAAVLKAAAGAALNVGVCASRWQHCRRRRTSSSLMRRARRVVHVRPTWNPGGRGGRGAMGGMCWGQRSVSAWHWPWHRTML